MTTTEKRELVCIGAAAFIARVALFAALVTILHFSPARIPQMRDGYHYLDYARGIAAGDFARIDAFHRRLFPGYPLLIAALNVLGIPTGAAALALNWLAAALTAPLTAILFRDRRIGWAMALLTPSYILYTTLAMSEATLMLMLVAGLVPVMREHPRPWAGVLHGFALVIRPFGFCASVGYAFAQWRKPRDVVRFALWAMAVVIAALIVMRLWSGSFVPGVGIYASNPRAYNGELFTWPFHSLIVTPSRIPVAPWKIAYIWAHVAVVLLGCAFACSEAWETRMREPLAALSAPWLIANTAVVLCIGSKWGFQEFHRFIIPALPPLLYTFRRWLPRGYAAWAAIGVASLTLAFFGASSGK
jgi:hypothetical protein